MTPDHVHISYHVSKLGVDIPSVSLPVGGTCRPDAPCFKKCYARRGRFCFQRNKVHLQNNLEMWLVNPEQYEYEVGIAAFFHGYFRWHSAGDIPNAAYLTMMVRVAKDKPNTRFLAFTKKYELVDEWLDANGMFPANLTIVLSAWGSLLPENPHNLPIAYIRFRKENGNVPSRARECPSYCGNCVATGMSCWDLLPGEAVVFNEH